MKILLCAVYALVCARYCESARWKRAAGTDGRLNVMLYEKLNATLIDDKRGRRNVVISPVVNDLPDEALVFESSESEDGQITIALTNCSVFQRPTERAFKQHHALLLVFQTSRDGLLWAYKSEYDSSKSYIYLQSGRLNLVGVGPDGAREMYSLTIRGPSFDKGFSSNIAVQLTFIVLGSRNLTVYVGDTLGLSVYFRHVPFMLMNVHGRLTLGVAPNTAELTDYEMSADFTGFIYNVLMFFEWPMDPSEPVTTPQQNFTSDKLLTSAAIQQTYGLSTLEVWPFLTDDPAHVTSNINKGGIRWASVLTAWIGVAHGHDSEKPMVNRTVDFSTQRNPATFYGAQAALRVVTREKAGLNFDLDLAVRRSVTMEFGLLSFDERGVVLFKGGDRRAFFCFELFDGYLHLTYNWESEATNRTRVCSRRVDEAIRQNMQASRSSSFNASANQTTYISKWGEVHITMRISRPTNPRLVISLNCDYNNDGVADDTKQIIVVSTGQSFGSYLYVGGVDGLARLPWLVFSRTYFNGALTYLRINGKYMPYENFFGQHSTNGVRLNSVDVTDYCSQADWCVANETGRCLADRPYVNGKTHRCDCAHLDRVASSCAPNPYVVNFTDSSFAIALNDMFRSHVDDLTISFKTTQTCFDTCVPGTSGLRGGTLLRVFNDANPNDKSFKVLEVRLLNGELEIALHINSSTSSKLLPTTLRINLFNFTSKRLNDAQWHTLRYLRRANELEFYIDQQFVHKTLIVGYGFSMETTQFSVACASDGYQSCQQGSFFNGTIRNLIWNAMDILSLLKVAKSSSSSTNNVQEILYNNEVLRVSVQNVIPYELLARTTSVAPTISADSFTLIGQPDSFIEVGLRELPAALSSRQSAQTAFAFRTTMRDCLLFYQRPRSAGELGVDVEYMKAELVNGILRFGARLTPTIAPFLRSGIASDGTISFSFANASALNDGAVHQFSVHVTLRDLTVQVDSLTQSFYFYMLYESLSNALFYDAVAFFGALPDTSSSVDVGTPRNAFYTGCFISIVLNQDSIDWGTVMAYNSLTGVERPVKRGCSNVYKMQCNDLNCANGASCAALDAGNARCFCNYTGYEGMRCDRNPFGFYAGPSGSMGGYLIDPLSVMPANRASDLILVGLLTQFPNGTILRVESVDRRRSLTLSLVNCALRIDYFIRRVNSSTLVLPMQTTGSLCDGMYNVLLLNRTDNQLTISIRRSFEQSNFGPFEFPMLTAMFAPSSYRMYVGVEAWPNASLPFNGIVAPLSWNGVGLNSRGKLLGDVLEVRHPYALFPLPCPNDFVGNACLNINPDSTTQPSGSIDGSAGNGDGYLATTRRFVVGDVKGTGSLLRDADADAVLGPSQQSADSQTLSPTTTIAFVVVSGVLMALSALIWAIYKCKPGAPASCLCLGTEYAQYSKVEGVGNATVGVSSVPSVKVLNGDTNDIPTIQRVDLRSAPPANLGSDTALSYEENNKAEKKEMLPVTYRDIYTEDIPIENKGLMRSAPPMALALSSVPATAQLVPASAYADQLVLSAADLMQSNAYGYEAAEYEMVSRGPKSVSSFNTTDEHVSSMTVRGPTRLVSMQRDANGALFVPDDAKVSCFALSRSADFVVTGSSIGAPSIWELRTGDLIRTVDGGDLLRCAHGLHLACADRILAGEVSSSTADDSQSGMRCLQLWEVANGRRIDLPYDIYCQASCMLHNDVEVACAAVDRSRQEVSVLIWNILTGQVTKHVNYSLLSVTDFDSGPAPFIPSNLLLHLYTSPPDDQLLLLGIERTNTNQPVMFVSFDQPTLSQLSYDEPASTRVDCCAKSVALLPHGVVVFGSRTGDLLLYDARTLRLLSQVNTAQLSAVHEHSTVQVSCSTAVTCLATSDDQSFIATGHGTDTGTGTGTGTRNFASLLAPADRTATEFNALRIWHVTSPLNATAGCGAQLRLVHILLGHSDDVTDCTFSSDNEYLISGSMDGSIRMWRVRDGTQACWFVSNVQVLRVRMTFSRQAIVALGEYQKHRKLIMLQLVRQKTKRTQPLNT